MGLESARFAADKRQNQMDYVPSLRWLRLMVY